MPARGRLRQNGEGLWLGKAPEALTGDGFFEIASFACTAASLPTQSAGGIGSVPEREAVEAHRRKEKRPC